MIVSMRYTQLECGLSTPYHVHNYEQNHHFVTPTWATHLWKYCSDSKVQIKESNTWVYSSPRCYDFFLMDVMTKSNIPLEHKEIFNQVRINLRLLTASDIVKAHRGTEILPNIM